MRDSFGARLRRHREDRGVSLAEIADQTKIKSSLLDGLERDDISQWPAGIFRRAYVRAYAAAIGFDPDAAVREFLALYPNSIEAPEPPAPPATGLRGLFGSFRRRPAPPVPSSPPVHAATATLGKRPAESPVPDPAVPPPAAAPAEEADLDFRIRDSSCDRPVDEPAQTGTPDETLLAAAKICTDLGRVENVAQVLPLLGDAAKVLGARGLIVWVWDAGAEELRPALVHGYPAKVRARLRGVSAEADNVTAAAYRAGAPLARSGALAIPLLAPAACAGVLAIELEDSREQDAGVCALATFFAATLAQLVGGPAAESRDADGAAPRAVAAQPN